MSYNEWLDMDVLEDYLDGKLDAKSMHMVEKLSLDDPFVAEALAGLSQSPKRTHALSLLQKQLKERIAQKPVEEKRWRITSQRLSIAAAAAVLFVTVSILFWMKENNRQQILAGKSKKIDINIAPQTAKAKPHIKSITPPPIIEEIPKLKDRSYSKYTSKAKATTIIADKPPLVTEAAVAKVRQPDSVVAISANAKAKEAEVKKEAKVIIAEQQTIAALKRAETVRERPLPGKAEGIYVETNPGRSIPVIINGRVYDKTDGQPLPGAIVKIAGTNKATTTNNKGEFVLPADSNAQSLSIAYIGFTSKEVKTQGNQSVNVALEAANSQLNEVIIAANNDDPENKSAKQPVNSAIAGVTSNASPTGGWQRFEEYLKANNKLFKESGRYVTLSFEMRKDGRTKSLKIINGLSKAENEEAIRLIKEGPNWVLQKDAVQPVTISIKF